LAQAILSYTACIRLIIWNAIWLLQVLMVSGRISLNKAICFAVLFMMASSEVVFMFEDFDKNRDEVLSEEEVRRGVVVGSQEDAFMLKFLFHTVDRDHDGVLNRWEASRLFQKITEHQPHYADMCRVHARGLRCLLWQMDEIERLRYSGVLEANSARGNPHYKLL